MQQSPHPKPSPPQPIQCGLACLFATALVARFLLGEVRCVTKAEPLRSGVSVRGIPRRQSLTLWLGVAYLPDEWNLNNCMWRCLRAVKDFTL